MLISFDVTSYKSCTEVAAELSPKPLTRRNLQSDNKFSALLAAALLSWVLSTFHLITIQKQAGRGKEIKHL
jgi:hypothetical protein